MWWDGARESKKSGFFVPYIFSEGSFFNICDLSQCIVYWTHFQDIHTFTHQKKRITSYKSPKALSVYLKADNE